MPNYKCKKCKADLLSDGLYCLDCWYKYAEIPQVTEITYND